MLLVNRSRPSSTSAVDPSVSGVPAPVWCAGSGSVVKAAPWASMCLAGSRARLTVTFPTCCCAGDTSVVAAGRPGVAAALAELLPDAACGEGLGTGLALTAGALDG